MSSLFDGTFELEDPMEIYAQMEGNYLGYPCSQSAELWKLRRECCISDHSTRRETMLEKAVAQLSKSGYMPRWFNQCPVASGIVDPYSDGGRRVDLVHWSETIGCARLIELKWGSNDPESAMQQVLRYGMAYLFCRVHQGELPLQGNPLMKARHVVLEVIAPHRFFAGKLASNRFVHTSKKTGEFVGFKTSDELTMSLCALAFPKEFDEVPFENGKDVKEECLSDELTEKGRIVRDAFAELTQVFPE